MMISDKLTSLYRRCGYERYKMGKFEEYGLYSEHRSFLPPGGMITFTDTDGRLMALKPDVTLSIVRNSRDGVSAKYCYSESVFRAGDDGRFAEVQQTGLEYIGEPDPVCVAEVLMLAGLSLDVISGENALGVSHLGLLSMTADRLGVQGEDREKLLYRIGHRNAHGALEICRAAGYDGERLLLGLLDADPSPDEAEKTLYALSDGRAWDEVVKTLFSAIRSARGAGFDFSVVADAGYYNGIVFRGYVEGVPKAVLSGGEYGNLMKKMGKNNSAAGFAVYLDRLPEYEDEDEEKIGQTVIYGDKTDPVKVAEKMRRVLEEGGSVRAVRENVDQACKKTVDLR